MGRMYTVEFENVLITAANGDYDLFSILAAAEKPVAVHAIFFDSISEVGDAEEEILRIRVIRGNTTAPSGGAAPTPVPLDPLDVAASFTARTADPTIAIAGTEVILHSGGFNVRTGVPLVFTPEMRPKLVPNQGAAAANEFLVVRLMAAVADDLNLSGTMYVEEV